MNVLNEKADDEKGFAVGLGMARPREGLRGRERGWSHGYPNILMLKKPRSR
jgi:hypothetical protein